MELYQLSPYTAQQNVAYSTSHIIQHTFFSFNLFNSENNFGQFI